METTGSVEGGSNFGKTEVFSSVNVSGSFLDVDSLDVYGSRVGKLLVVDDEPVITVLLGGVSVLNEKEVVVADNVPEYVRADVLSVVKTCTPLSGVEVSVTTVSVTTVSATTVSATAVSISGLPCSSPDKTSG